MARRPRIHRNGAFYHVMLRGNNKQPIFFSDQDRCRFCLLIQQGVERFGHQVHGFCLMENHVHLILQVNDISVSQILHHLSFRYTLYINKVEERVGHLFQGRFKAILVEDTAYLLELVRYVHLNPVRAGIVFNPEQYRWSSHEVYLGAKYIPWLTHELILVKFDIVKEKARERFQEFFKQAMKEGEAPKHFKKGSHEGRFLGSDDFVNRVLQEDHQGIMKKPIYLLNDIIDVVCQVMNYPVSTITMPGQSRIVTEVRAIIAFFVKQSPHLTIKELAVFLRKDSSAISRLAQAVEQKAFDDQVLASRLKEISKELECKIATLHA